MNRIPRTGKSGNSWDRRNVVGLRHVNRLIALTAGGIYINSTDVNKLNAEELRVMRADNTGMVFQNMALLRHRPVVDKEAERVVDIVGLQGYGNRMPLERSGGMQ